MNFVPQFGLLSIVGIFSVSTYFVNAADMSVGEEKAAERQMSCSQLG